MAEQILHGSNVVTAAEQGRRERVAEGVRCGGLRDACLFYGTFEGALKGLVIHVMATHDTAPWIGRMRVLRKNPEPRPGMPGARILPLKGVGKRNAAAALGLVLQPPCPCTRQLLAQAGCEPRQPGGCKLKTAPVRPVVAARPAEYVCSEDLFY